MEKVEEKYLGPNRDGDLVTEYRVFMGGVRLATRLVASVYDTPEEIDVKRRAALDELAEKIKIEDQRQREGSLGFGYVGG